MDIRDFVGRPGNLIPYPGIRQTGDTCVYASVGGAVNFLMGQAVCSESGLVKAVDDASGDASFGWVVKCLPPECDGVVKSDEFHDRDNPLTDYAIVSKCVASGGVLIVSLQLVTFDAGGIPSLLGWHMLSLFSPRGNDLQVWDSNNHSGFLTAEETKEIVTGSRLAIPYGRSRQGHERFLVPHDAHHILLVGRMAK